MHDTNDLDGAPTSDWLAPAVPLCAPCSSRPFSAVFSLIKEARNGVMGTRP
jgi:hypothetical protein